MRIPNTFLAAVLALTLAACSPDPAEVSEAGGADLILTNGRVYTLAWEEPAADGTLTADAPVSNTGWHPDAEAVATKDGEIIFVGSTREAMEFQGDATRVVDMAGATIIPGLVDSHTHVYGLGAKLDSIDLTDIPTEEEAVALVAEKVRTTPEGEWIIGRGWDEGAWANRYPDKVLLSQAAPNNPVFMDSLHGFAVWVNQAALDAGGITADTEIPVGGEMRLGDDGTPNGLFLNRATTMIDDIVPPPSMATSRFMRPVSTRRRWRRWNNSRRRIACRSVSTACFPCAMSR
jgi:predicted amidohydrolase YtcJ